MSRHNAASNVHDVRGIGKHNVSHLIYVPLIALNTSVYPTANVSSNHEPIKQSYTVSTEVVCNSRKTTLCSSPCTISSNVNNTSKSTSDKLHNILAIFRKAVPNIVYKRSYKTFYDDDDDVKNICCGV
jgi:hypothetical protein